jgi:hypothetical protein
MNLPDEILYIRVVLRAVLLPTLMTVFNATRSYGMVALKTVKTLDPCGGWGGACLPGRATSSAGGMKV